MHEPIWFTEKEWSLAGELVAVVAAAALLVVAVVSRPSRARAPVAA
jgi:hypothetical protein